MKLKNLMILIFFSLALVCNLSAQVSSSAGVYENCKNCKKWEERNVTVTVRECKTVVTGYRQVCQGRGRPCIQVPVYGQVCNNVQKVIKKRVCVDCADGEEPEVEPSGEPNNCSSPRVTCQERSSSGSPYGDPKCCAAGQICGYASFAPNGRYCCTPNSGSDCQNPGEDPGEDPTEEPSGDPGEDPGEDPTEEPSGDPGVENCKNCKKWELRDVTVTVRECKTVITGYRQVCQGRGRPCIQVPVYGQVCNNVQKVIKKRVCVDCADGEEPNEEPSTEPSGEPNNCPSPRVMCQTRTSSGSPYGDPVCCPTGQICGANSLYPNARYCCDTRDPACVGSGGTPTTPSKPSNPPQTCPNGGCGNTWY